MSPDLHAYGKCRNPFCLPDFVSGSHAQGTRVMSGHSPRILLHIPPTDPPRRIYRLADSSQRNLSPAGRSFDPSAEGAMTTARPPLPLIICPCLSLLSTDYLHTLRRCSLTVRTLCLRREEWDHDPPAVTTRNSSRRGLKQFFTYRSTVTGSSTAGETNRQRDWDTQPPTPTHPYPPQSGRYYTYTLIHP